MEKGHRGIDVGAAKVKKRVEELEETRGYKDD